MIAIGHTQYHPMFFLYYDYVFNLTSCLDMVFGFSELHALTDDDDEATLRLVEFHSDFFTLGLWDHNFIAKFLNQMRNAETPHM